MALKVEYVATRDLREYGRNARTHSVEQVAQIAASIREFGFTNPILIDEKSEIIAGHGRLQAAISLGAERSGRVCYAMELQPQYVDVIVKRWQKETGRRARLESTGEMFDDLAKKEEQVS